MKKIIFVFSFTIFSLLSVSSFCSVSNDCEIIETVIIDECGNVHHTNDGYDCLINLGDGTSFGDC